MNRRYWESAAGFVTAFVWALICSMLSAPVLIVTGGLIGKVLYCDDFQLWYTITSIAFVFCGCFSYVITSNS